MDRVAFMEEQSTSESVAFISFTRYYAKKRVVAFFEGEDEKYYTSKINSILSSSSWSSVVCGGKKKVLAVRNVIRENEAYCNAVCMFFVDADFDNNKYIQECEDVYLTPCHSVENFYFSENLVRQVISAELKVYEEGDESERYGKLLNLFNDLVVEYSKAIKPYNVMIDMFQNALEKGALTGGLNLNNIQLDHIVNIDVNAAKVTGLTDYNDARRLFPDLRGDIESIIFIDRFGEGCNCKMYRGKENLEFLRIFLVNLKEDRCKKQNRFIFENRAKVGLQLTKGNTLTELNGYSDFPRCLREYISRFS
ncbi:DUF4435 domain-containing protein [Cobetia marina]|uniref:DUF4435 domain-containing protein n=1 Tax=Cobetia marina TaxID=28258 RepID=UPI002547D0BA|nr:DUF4435 domain-containing protein [Cobetia pacifica]MDI6002880.1 DUF4435 domain-containing protein [Cobetia pacifica]